MQHGKPPTTSMGIEAAKELREEVNDIVYQYHRLAMQYDSMNIKSRRSATRQYAEERFFCAAILQFQSDVNGLTKENWFTLGTAPTDKRELPIHEDCPVARKWYTSLFEGEALLGQFVQVGYPVDKIQQIRDTLAHARWSLEKTQDWMRTILLVEGETDDTSPQATMEGWNVLVTDVRDANLHPAVAAKNAAAYLSTRPPMPMERFNVPAGKTRYWFDYDMVMPN